MEAKELAQRVAFIFSLCSVLTEGRDEKGEPASLPGQARACNLFLADTGGRGNMSAWEAC